MAKEKNEEIKKAIDIIDEMSMDPAEWEMYEARRLAIMDYNTGIRQAKLEEKEKIAKELLQMGMKKEDVAKVTELSMEELEKISTTIKKK